MIVGNKQIAEKLNKYFPEVKWDRFVRENSSPDEANLIYTLYGWIDRDTDSYKDFVIVSVYWDGEFYFYTSSAKYSATFQERIYGTTDGHTDCERVEQFFPDIVNVIKLEEGKI